MFFFKAFLLLLESFGLELFFSDFELRISEFFELRISELSDVSHSQNCR